MPSTSDLEFICKEDCYAEGVITEEDGPSLQYDQVSLEEWCQVKTERGKRMGEGRRKKLELGCHTTKMSGTPEARRESRERVSCLTPS